jgi:hypothetical protein
MRVKARVRIKGKGIRVRKDTGKGKDEAEDKGKGGIDCGRVLGCCRVRNRVRKGVRVWGMIKG